MTQKAAPVDATDRGPEAVKHPGALISAPPPPPQEAGLPFVQGWRIVSVEALGKRAVAECMSCGQTRAISLVGGSPSCGCGRGARAEALTFANSIGADAQHIARKVHRGRR